VIKVFSAFISRARAVRRLGSAALDLCYVGAGRFDGFWEKKLQPWDVAGGALIVMEAGGLVTTLTGDPYASREGSVLASNGHIHDEMLHTLASVQRSGGRSQ
jgi:myo-inositol-1(or 4)-monophosphatase